MTRQQQQRQRKAAVITITDYSFAPKSLTVPVGTAVVFRHGKKSPKPEECLLRFMDEEATGWTIHPDQPQEFSRTFDSVGTYEFFEENYVFMRGSVQVVEEIGRAAATTSIPSVGKTNESSNVHDLAYLEYTKARKQRRSSRTPQTSQKEEDQPAPITKPTLAQFGSFGDDEEEKIAEEPRFNAKAAREFMQATWEEVERDESVVWL